jgi:hypothetical protein
LLNARTRAHIVPTPPAAEITDAGAKCSAAAPATMTALPWARLIPPWAMPNAWLRWDGGVAWTNEALAASW